MNAASERFPVLTRGLGQWTGTYTFMDPEGHLLDTYRVDCLSEFPDDGDADFRLTVHSVWPDGRETDAVYRADLRDDRLEWRDGLIGWIDEIDDRTVYLTFCFEGDPDVRVCEMIQISPDGQSRARTWHWFRKDRLFQITLTREQRMAAPAV